MKTLWNKYQCTKPQWVCWFDHFQWHCRLHTLQYLQPKCQEEYNVEGQDKKHQMSEITWNDHMKKLECIESNENISSNVSSFYLICWVRVHCLLLTTTLPKNWLLFKVTCFSDKVRSFDFDGIFAGTLVLLALAAPRNIHCHINLKQYYFR